MVLAHSGSAPAVEVDFEQEVYVTTPGRSVEVRVLIDHDGHDPASLFSYGLSITSAPEAGVSVTSIGVPAELDFIGFYAGAEKDLTPGIWGVRGNVDMETVENYFGSHIATYVVEFAQPGSYDLGLALYRTLGPNDDVFVDGNGVTIDDELIPMGTAVVDVTNTPPVADAGDDRQVILGQSVQLDGSAEDADGDSIQSWAWAVAGGPPGSAPVVVGSNTATPTFTPDMEGTFRLRLVVNDGWDNSAPDEVTLDVVAAGPPASPVLEIISVTGSTATFAARNLDPAKTYRLRRGPTPAAFPDPVGPEVSGVEEIAPLMDSPRPVGRAFYRLEVVAHPGLLSPPVLELVSVTAETATFAARNLDPEKVYRLRRGPDPTSFPDSVGPEISGVEEFTSLQDSPRPPSRAFYRLELVGAP